MLTVECKLYHSKKEQEKTVVAFEKNFKDNNEKHRSSTQPFTYRAQGSYNLFGSSRGQSTSLVLLRDSVPGKTIEEFFSTKRKSKNLHKALDSFTRYYELNKVYQPSESESEVFENSVKPLVKRLMSGHSSTIVVGGSQRARNNKALYRLNPAGFLMQIYECTNELYSFFRKGGKYPQGEFSLKARGFNLAGELRTDVFTLNPLDDKSFKPKSFKLDTKDDMIQFCKIARNSLSVIKAAMQRPEIEDEAIQCLQLVFEVKQGNSVVQKSTLSIVKVITTKDSVKTREHQSLYNYLHCTVVAKTTKCDVTSMSSLRKEDAISKYFKNIFSCSSKFYLLLLLQTSEDFLGNKATLSYFKGIIAARENSLINKTLRTRCLNDDSCMEESSANSYEYENNLGNQHRKGSYGTHKGVIGRYGGSNDAVSDVYPIRACKTSLQAEISDAPTASNMKDKLVNHEALEKLNSQISQICKSYGLNQEEKEKITIERDLLKENVIRDRLKEMHESSMAELRDKLHKEESERRRQEGEIAVLKLEVKKQAENRMKEIDMATTEQLKALEDRDRKIQAKQLEVDRLERERDRVRHELDQKERMITNGKYELEEVLSKLKEANSKMLNLEQLKTSLERDKQHLKSEAEEASDIKIKFEKQFQKELQNQEQLKEELEQKLLGKIRTLENQLRVQETKNSVQTNEIDAIKTELGDINGLYKVALEKQSSLQNENNRMQTEIIGFRTELDKTKDLLIMKEAELREIKSQCSNMNITKRELEENKKKHQERVADLQKQLTSSYEEAKQLKIKVKDLKKDSDSKQQNVDELRAAIESTQARSQRDQSHAQAEIDTLTQTLRSCQDTLKKERDTISGLKTENEAVSTQCRKLKDKNSSLQIEIDTMKVKLNQVEGYVEKRIVDSNAELRHFSQNTPTAKKNSYREEAISGLLSMVSDYRSNVSGRKHL